MKRTALLFLVGVGVLPACRERGHPDPNVRMVVSHKRADPSGGEDLARNVPSRLIVPPQVQETYSGIRLAWKDASSGQEGTLEVPLGGAATLPDASLEVRADIFLPSFTMTEDTITSSGIEPENPAARIEVREDGNELFGGWIFSRFPDVHPFTHPRFSIRLEGGVRRASP